MTMTMTPTKALTMLTLCSMSEFTSEDWKTFSGLETENPKVGYFGSFTILVDGSKLFIFEESSLDEFIFELR